MILVKTRLTPIRMIIGQKEPVNLEVMLRNTGDGEVMTSVIVTTPPGLGLDRSCIAREKRQRLDYIKPGEEKTVNFKVFPKFNVKEGDYEILVNALTHPDRYDKISSKRTHKTVLRVLE